MRIRCCIGLVISAALGLTTRTLAADVVKINGYLEYQKPPYLIVDAQRIQVTDKTKLKAGQIKVAAELPLGYEIQASGTRAQDGTLVADQIEAKKNGSEFMEKD